MDSNFEGQELDTIQANLEKMHSISSFLRSAFGLIFRRIKPTSSDFLTFDQSQALKASASPSSKKKDPNCK
jgi:hypothetical protein